MSKPVSRIDTLALDGFRGLAALHVMTGHYWGTGSPGMEMSLFYLLSGFTLTLSYGRERAEENTSWIISLIKTLKFYQNRFARIGPSFYLSNIIMYLLTHSAGSLLWHRGNQARWFFTLTITNSWFTFFDQDAAAFNGPSWTVSTLTMMYLVFPLIIRPMRKLSDANLARGIVLLFYIQLLPFCYTYDKLGIWWVIKNPVFRMPVFLMGILAGLQRLRDADNESFIDANLPRNLLHDILPWGMLSSGKQLDPEEKERKWRWRVERCGLLLGGIILCYYAVYKRMEQGEKWRKPYSALYSGGKFIFVHLQLLIMQGLTADGGRSVLGKLLRARPLTFLGRISMAVYLYHRPTFLIFEEYFGQHRFKPRYVFLNLFMVLIVGTIVTFLVEEPYRNFFKATSKPRKQENKSVPV